jgi:CIC family chloride channel protein
MAAFVAVELTGDWQLLPLLLAVDTFGWPVARKLYPNALYAIASQMPVPEGLARLHRFGWSVLRPR